MDAYAEKLKTMLATHPAWISTAKTIRDGSSSRVYFSHLPGEFHLLRKDGQSLLIDEPAEDPDFAFRFTPRSIDRLCAVKGSEQADFAIELFDCVVSDDPEVQVGLRVIAGFTRLVWRGYVTMLLRGGPRVLAYGATRGIHSVSDLRKFMRQTRASDPRWEHL